MILPFNFHGDDKPDEEMEKIMLEKKLDNELKKILVVLRKMEDPNVDVRFHARKWNAKRTNQVRGRT
jgi:hypothetical protein